MQYLPPFVLHGTHRLHSADIDMLAIQYELLLTALVHDRIQEDEWKRVSYLNELIPISQTVQT
jgi:glutathione-regulated potassium-efflux system ancillary protein KefG